MGDVEGATARRRDCAPRVRVALRETSSDTGGEVYDTRRARETGHLTAAGVRIGEQDFVILNRIFDRAG